MSTLVDLRGRVGQNRVNIGSRSCRMPRCRKFVKPSDKFYSKDANRKKNVDIEDIREINSMNASGQSRTDRIVRSGSCHFDSTVCQNRFE